MVEIQQITPMRLGLSPQQQIIYELQLEGLSIKEIAAALSIGYESAKTQARRIRQKYKKFKESQQSPFDEDMLKHLEGRQQQVVYLRQNGFKIKDAAKILGIEAATARHHVYRAKQNKRNKSPIIKYTLPERELQAVIERSRERNKPLSKDTISMIYRVTVESDKATREELNCIGAIGSGCFDYSARDVALKERAKSFVALTEKNLTYISREDLHLLGDVVEDYFRHVKDQSYKPRTENAQEVLKEVYEERREMLEAYGGVMIRKTNDGAPGKAYPLVSIDMTLAGRQSGVVIGLRQGSILVKTGKTGKKVKEIMTDKVIVYDEEEKPWAASHRILREDDVISFGEGVAEVRGFSEKWRARIVEKS